MCHEVSSRGGKFTHWLLTKADFISSEKILNIEKPLKEKQQRNKNGMTLK